MRLSKLRKLSAQWSFFHLWQLENEEMAAFFLTPLRNLQISGAFITALTSKKRSIHLAGQYLYHCKLSL
jgi:hypothetical protein